MIIYAEPHISSMRKQGPWGLGPSARICCQLMGVGRVRLKSKIFDLPNVPLAPLHLGGSVPYNHAL